MYSHNSDDFPVNPPLASIFTLSRPLLHEPTLLFTYLKILLLLLVVRIPIHSCPLLAINCSPLAASPTPRHPTDQVTYLHRQHQQHQSSRLIQLVLTLIYFIELGRVVCFIVHLEGTLWSAVSFYKEGEWTSNQLVYHGVKIFFKGGMTIKINFLIKGTVSPV